MTAKQKKKLRSGYTTGACAAAATKAAILFLLTGTPVERVEIPFPDGSRHVFSVCRCQKHADRPGVFASIVKDAGDDPDVTNGAEIGAAVILADSDEVLADCVVSPDGSMALCRGEGVGMVSKPGLAVAPGEPAINPVPRAMIFAAAREASGYLSRKLQITISIRDGEKLAAKTLNHRLGIIGGLSVLGTTGIVRPVSADAWKATISASLAVAREAGLDVVVLSTGRTSEKGVQDLLELPEEAYAMMGDYLEFSLLEAAGKGFGEIYLAGMWAKIMKAALGIPQTHVRHGSLETEQALELLMQLGAGEKSIKLLQGVNTAREIYVRLTENGEQQLIKAVCQKAQAYARKVAGVPVTVFLVGSDARVVERV